jgi:hypothetical protein
MSMCRGVRGMLPILCCRRRRGMRTATRDGGERASGRPALGEGVYWSVMSVMPGADGAGNITVTTTPCSEDMSASLMSRDGVIKALAGITGTVPRSRAACVSRMPIA